jgi:hypothetical protein
VRSLYRCHFLDAFDQVNDHEEIDAGSLMDAIVRANASLTIDLLMMRSRFGRVIDGSTAQGEITKASGNTAIKWRRLIPALENEVR